MKAFLGIDLGTTNLKAALYDEAVFAVQRHDVRDCCQCRQITELLQCRFPVSAFHCRNQLQDDHGAADRLIRGRTVRPERIDHGNGLRQRIAGAVVVGDDQIHAQFLNVFCFFDGRNAVVHGHNQGYAVLMELLQAFAAHAVALSACRDIPCHIRARTKEPVRQHDRCGHAVAVIVTVYTYPLAAFRCCENPFRSTRHIREQKRVGKAGYIQQAARSLQRFDPAGDQYLRTELCDPALLPERCRLFRIRLSNFPSFQQILPPPPSEWYKYPILTFLISIPFL